VSAEPNIVDTAIALLTLKTALKSPAPLQDQLRENIINAILKGEKFLQTHWSIDEVVEEECWKGILPHTAGIMLDSLLISSLNW
jgi:hypothetical protein